MLIANPRGESPTLSLSSESVARGERRIICGWVGIQCPSQPCALERTRAGWLPLMLRTLTPPRVAQSEFGPAAGLLFLHSQPFSDARSNRGSVVELSRAAAGDTACESRGSSILIPSRIKSA